jgi:hypothetical protein
MKSRLWLCLAVVAAFGATLWAQPLEGTQKTDADFSAQLQSCRSETESAISALEQQILSADHSQSEDLQRQIARLKKDGEIRRLRILLAWAQSEGNTARIAEVQKALDSWLNPPSSSHTPAILTPEDKAASPPDRPAPVTTSNKP